MYCFRRRGHNEADEPAFTQPALYRVIERRPSVHESYLERLLALGGITRKEAEEIAEEHRAGLDRELSVAKRDDFVYRSDLGGVWAFYIGGREREAADVDTGVRQEVLCQLLKRLVELPEGFQPHPKIAKLLETRKQMIDGTQPIDWSAGEALAMASLAVQGLRVRLSGQDSQRGTFSHRHAVIHDVVTDETYCPLEHLSEDQASVEIYNSPLSEAGVLGFEYGYSLDCPDGLVMWEAQFGDFVNAAQVVIDQFIVSAEDKWNRLSGIVMLLPHGFEGMGPEHSSARLERFLSLAAKDNIQVVQPTTPAQIFHCLRRQVLRVWRKPLVVMTPKSLLRHPGCVSSMDDLVRGSFQRVIPDRGASQPREIRRILLCSGRSGGRKRDVMTSRSSASSSSTRCPAGRSRRRSPTTPSARRPSGCRRSRKTWARGGSCESTSARGYSSDSRSRGSAARAPRAPRRDRRRATISSRTNC
jgi:2-oxoglutarate dehydrogenase E1 component